MKGSILALVLGLGLVMAGTTCASTTHKLNGDIDVAPGQTVGDVSTVNGDIHVGQRATVGEATTVNGSITMDAHSSAEELKAVNGAITLKNGVRVHDEVEAVNGDITLGKGVDVHGEVSNVAGDISLQGAHVGDGLETVAGDITVGPGSHVEGGIKVENPHGHVSDTSHTPRIVIGPHAVVTGTLEFQRPVNLYVSDSAKIGPVVGAKVHKFSGARP